MIRQRTYGSIVQHIEPPHLQEMPVPLLDVNLQEQVHALVDAAAVARGEASKLLDEAAAYFDDLSGDMLSMHDHALAIGTVPRGALNGRLDSFHHVGWAAEPRFVGTSAIGSNAKVTRPGIFRRIWTERGVPFVSGIDAYQVRPTARQRLRRDEAERSGAIVETGQTLVQRSGQRYGLLGRPAAVTDRMDGWAASEDMMRITPANPDTGAAIFAFLRSDSGRRVLLRQSYGTSIPHFNQENLAGVVLPEVPSAVILRARRALVLREQADRDEEQAIKEVENWLA
jgi:type I restriction enzyme S subunit